MLAISTKDKSGKQEPPWTKGNRDNNFKNASFTQTMKGPELEATREI